MSPDWQGCMRLEMIILGWEWVALWSPATLFRIKVGFSPCVRFPTTLHPTICSKSPRGSRGDTAHTVSDISKCCRGRKPALLSRNVKGPEGMKGQQRSEWRGKEKGAGEAGGEKERDDGRVGVGTWRWKERRDQTKWGAWVWKAAVRGHPCGQALGWATVHNCPSLFISLCLSSTKALCRI